MEQLTAQQIQTVADSPLFAGLERAFVASACERFAIAARFLDGETIFEAGDELKCLGVIVAGRATVYKHAGSARVIMSMLGPGDLTGAAGIFLRGAHAVTSVVAKGNTAAVFFSEESLKALMREQFAFTENYLGYLTARIHFLTGRIEAIASPTATGKLHAFLLNNAENGRLTPGRGYGGLAEALSISRASLYRAMAELEAHGIISRKGKTIELLNILED